MPEMRGQARPVSICPTYQLGCKVSLMRPPSHCPWVYNCIGINNHRHFFFYLIYLTVGIIFYDWLLYYCKWNLSFPALKMAGC
jgi:hypothetical protein